MYDAGILNDFGGGNVGWWHDYIRSLLNLAHEHYQDEIDREENEIADLKAENERLTKRIEELKANQMPDEPICPRCKKPRKFLGIIWDNHIGCKH